MREYATRPRYIPWAYRCRVVVHRTILSKYSALSHPVSHPVRRIPHSMYSKKTSFLACRMSHEDHFESFRDKRKKGSLRLSSKIPLFTSLFRGGRRWKTRVDMRLSAPLWPPVLICCIPGNTSCSNTIPILCTENGVSIVLTIYSLLC